MHNNYFFTLLFCLLITTQSIVPAAGNAQSATVATKKETSATVTIQKNQLIKYAAISAVGLMIATGSVLILMDIKNTKIENQESTIETFRSTIQSKVSSNNLLKKTITGLEDTNKTLKSRNDAANAKIMLQQRECENLQYERVKDLQQNVAMLGSFQKQSTRQILDGRTEIFYIQRLLPNGKIETSDPFGPINFPETFTTRTRVPQV